MRYTLITLSSLLTTLHALTITSPAKGATVDPSQPIVVRWTTSPSDPATFDLVVKAPSDNVYSITGSGTTTVATGVQASSGTYTIPANKVAGFGTGYTVSAQSGGNSIASSESFLLGYGSNQVVSGSNLQYSLAPSSTGNSNAETSLSSLTFNTAGATGSVTATYLTGPSVTPTGSATSSGSLSSLVFTTDGVTGSMTIMTSTRSGTSSSGSSTFRSSSASSASSSASAAATNAQPRIGAGKEIMAGAGLLAGLVALVA